MQGFTGRGPGLQVGLGKAAEPTFILIDQ